MISIIKLKSWQVIILSSLLFAGCVKDVAENGEDTGGSGNHLSGIPDNFNFSTTVNKHLKVNVHDEYDGQYYYTIEVYDANPANDPSATLLAGGKTNKNTSFDVNLILPATQKEIYIQQTHPAGYKFISVQSVTDSDLVLDYNSLPAPGTKSAVYNKWGEAADYNDLFKKNIAQAVEIQQGDILETGGVYKITTDYEGNINFPDGKFILYIGEGCKLKLTNSGQPYVLKDAAEIYVLQNASLEGSGEKKPQIEMDRNTKIFNAGIIALENLDMGGNAANLTPGCVVYNHPGGKIYLDGLRMNGSEIHNHCLISIAGETVFHDTGSSLSINQNASFVSGSVTFKNGTAGCRVDMLAKALFETGKLIREGYVTVSVNGDPYPLAMKDMPLFKVNNVLDCGFYNMNFYYHVAVYAQGGIKGSAMGAAYLFQDNNLPVYLEGDCYGVEYKPDEKDPTEESKDPEYNEDDKKTVTYTYMFEDNWPTFGDYDMNDAVMDVNIANTVVGGNATLATITTTVRAVGATKPLYAYALIEAEGMQKMLIPLADQELHALMGVGVTEYVNTFGYTSDNVSVTKEIDLPAGIKGTVNADNLNVFIVWGDISSNQWNEIHLPGYEGTPQAGTSPSSVQYKYKSASTETNSDSEYENMMWALMIPAKNFKSYPKENISILQAYPGFSEWAKSGGTEKTDWYTQPANESNLYQGKSEK